MIRKETKTLEERGLHSTSYFSVLFKDGTTRTEHDTNWSEMSEVVAVKYFGGIKTVLLATVPIHKISVLHGKMHTEIEVPKDCRVYQAIRSESSLGMDGKATHRIVGRVVGLVKNGEVIEERFLDGNEGGVRGLKK